jgi:hypothetical protein
MNMVLYIGLLLLIFLLHFRLRAEKAGATTGCPLLLRHQLADGYAIIAAATYA